MSEEVKEVTTEKKAKGRKFIALQEGIVFGIIYIIACMANEKLVDLAMFAAAVIGLVGVYLGANAIKGLKK